MKLFLTGATLFIIGFGLGAYVMRAYYAEIVMELRGQFDQVLDRLVRFTTE